MLNVGLYLPKKKADKLGLTRSPQAEFLGLCNRRGPESPIIRAPTGAVRRIDSTATVSTSMPYFCSCSLSFVLAMSKAVEPIAAWGGRRQQQCFLTVHSQKDIYFFTNISVCVLLIEMLTWDESNCWCVLQKQDTPYIQSNISVLTNLHCGFGHPRQSYEHFLLHVKARTHHTHKGEQDSNQEGNEQGCYTQT